MRLLASLAIALWLLAAPAWCQAIVPVQMRDANLQTTNTQNYITTLQAFTAPRTLTIPDRSSLNAYFIQFIDTAGAINAIDTLTIQVSGGALINGASTLVISATSVYVFLAPSAAGYSATIIPQTASTGGPPGGTSGQVQYNNSGVFGGFTVSGDGTLNTSTGVFTFGTVNANVGTFGSATQCANVTVNAKGLVTAAGQNLCTPAIANVTGLGTGVVTALGINVGTAGSIVVNGGALGTPSSATLTNATGLPIAGLTGLGTGIGAALAVNVGSAGAPVLFNGAGGTPTSLTLTNALGLPIAGGGCGGTTAATCLNNITPTPTRAGDLMYWNGSSWVTLAGNNSGTQFLQENSSGVPSWATVSGTGTMTSATVTAGAGMGTFTGTCTSTTVLNCTIVGSAAQLPGIASNTAASAGNLGETQVANVVIGSGTTLTNATATYITGANVTLGAGDWDCDGTLWVSGTATNDAEGWLSSAGTAASPTRPNNGADSKALLTGAGVSGSIGIALSRKQFLVNGSTTVSLGAFVDSVGAITTTGFGEVYCRRMR